MDKTKAPTVTEQLLREIQARGDRGMSFAEMQHFVFVKAHPDRDFFERGSGGRTTRGFWCTNFYGSGNRQGLISLWLVQHPETRRYTLKPGKEIKGPFFHDPVRRAEERRQAEEYDRQTESARQANSIWNKVG
jgi:hypothetical protein